MPASESQRQRGVEMRGRIVEFIRGFCATNGFGPTWREIGDGVGLRSTNAVDGHMQRLRAEGTVTWHPRKQRTVRAP